MCFKYLERRKIKIWFFRSVEGGGEIRVGNGFKIRVLLFFGWEL